jgi:hypothetical protein
MHSLWRACTKRILNRFALQAGFTADTIEVRNGAISTFFDVSTADVVVDTGASIMPVTLQDSFLESRSNTLRAKSLTIRSGAVVGCLECLQARTVRNDAFGYSHHCESVLMHACPFLPSAIDVEQ